MTDSGKDPNDDTARTRMEATAAATRRPGARRVDAGGPEDEDSLAATARQTRQRSTPSVAEIHEPQTRLGRYLPIEELGRGGMGRVLRAYDPELEREVALKVLYAGAVDSLAWARMAREARTMAKLNHPNVVAVYDVVDDPRYGRVIAMELVKGSTLKKWLEERPRSWREVLEAFIEAGRGLAAAHAQGLLHRDFKPANALVALGEREGTRGPVKVTDFGLARRNREEPSEGPVSSVEGLDRAGAGETLTEDGVLMGTPVYMPPEQYRGDTLTSAADQYAFCVALWEAMYGERPIGGSSFESIAANVLEGRRRPPAKGRAIPSRLRRACERGLSLDPSQRWPSMEALLAALHGLVALRARRWMALGLAGGLAVLGGGLGLAQYAEVMDRCTGARAQLAGIWDEGRKQEVEAAILGTELVYAPGTWERVERELDEYADAWADGHTEACEATSVRREQSTEVMDLRMGCLRERRTALRAAVDVLARADEEVVEKAVDLVAGLPMLTRCDDVDLLDAEAEGREALPADPETRRELEELDTLVSRAHVAVQAGRRAEALALAQQAVHRADALGLRWPLAAARFAEAVAADDDGDAGPALAAYEAAFTAGLAAGHDEVVALAAMMMGGLHSRTGGFDEAQRWLELGAAAIDRRGDRGDELLAELESARGRIDFHRGAFDSALEHFRRSLELDEAAGRGDHPLRGAALLNIGQILSRLGRYEESLTSLEEALACEQHHFGESHPRVVRVLTSLCDVRSHAGRIEAALAACEQGLVFMKQTAAPDDPTLVHLYTNYGTVLFRAGRYTETERVYLEALALAERIYGPDDPMVGNLLNNLGVLYVETEELAKAKEQYGRALKLFDAAFGPEHPAAGILRTNLAMVHTHLDELDEAEALLRRSIEVLEAALGKDHVDLALSLAELGRIESHRGRPREAIPLLERAQALREAAGGETIELADTKYALALAAWEVGQKARAHELLGQARKLYAEAGGERLVRLEEIDAWLAAHPI